MRTVACLAVLLLAPFTNALAQEQPLQPGQRVRITAPDLGINQQVATFDALASGVLIVTADSTMRFALADVTRLDMLAGRRGHPWRGAGLGFLGGAIVGTAIAAGATDTGDEWYDLIVAFGAGVGAGSGLLVGAVAGAFIKTDRWEEVPLDRLRVSVVPQRDGRFGLGLSLRF